MIIGASGHGKVIEEIARLSGYQTIEYLDDRMNELRLQGMNVVGCCNDFIQYINDYDFALGIGNNSIRMKLFEAIKNKNGWVPSLIHPSAVISDKAEIGAGTYVMANAVLNPACKVGEACIINTAATVDHDCEVMNYAHISPGAHLAGNVTVGELSWIGIGSCIIQGIEVGSNCIVGAGAVVIREVSDNTIVVGNPAKKIYNLDGELT